MSQLAMYIVTIGTLMGLITFAVEYKEFQRKRKVIIEAKVEKLEPSEVYIVSYTSLLKNMKWQITPRPDHLTFITTNTYSNGRKSATINTYAAGVVIYSVYFEVFVSLGKLED